MLKTMRTASVIFLLCAIASAQSQDAPVVEFFNSYSHAFGGNGNAPGWLAHIAINRNRFYGYFGEFSHHYRDARINLANDESKDVKGFDTLLLGIQIYIKKQSPVSPFIRLTVGGTTETSPITVQGKTYHPYGPVLLLGAGCGLDIKLRGRLALRAIQLDHLNPGADKPKRVRVSSGLVVRF